MKHPKSLREGARLPVFFYLHENAGNLSHRYSNIKAILDRCPLCPSAHPFPLRFLCFNVFYLVILRFLSLLSFCLGPDMGLLGLKSMSLSYHIVVTETQLAYPLKQASFSTRWPLFVGSSHFLDLCSKSPFLSQQCTCHALFMIHLRSP